LTCFGLKSAIANLKGSFVGSSQIFGQISGRTNIDPTKYDPREWLIITYSIGAGSSVAKTT